MLDLTDKKFADYTESRFGNAPRADCNKNIVALSAKLSLAEMSELQEFDRKTSDIYELISRDEEEYVSEKEIASIHEYEKLADSTRIAPQHKITMYEYVLLGIDKFDVSNSHTVQIIEKIVDNLQSGQKYDLQRYARILASHQQLENVGLYKSVETKINNKIKGKKNANSEEISQNYAQLKRLDAHIASPMFSSAQKLEMLQKQLELSSKCGFGRAKMYYKQADIYEKMATCYACEKDVFNCEECKAKSADLKYLAENTMRHAKKRGKPVRSRKYYE